MTSLSFPFAVAEHFCLLCDGCHSNKFTRSLSTYFIRFVSILLSHRISFFHQSSSFWTILYLMLLFCIFNCFINITWFLFSFLFFYFDQPRWYSLFFFFHSSFFFSFSTLPIYFRASLVYSYHNIDKKKCINIDRFLIRKELCYYFSYFFWFLEIFCFFSYCFSFALISLNSQSFLY